MFSSEFSLEPENLLPQNRCFVRGCRQFSSSHLTKCHACHGICTLSPLDAALTMRFHKARSTTRLKCAAPATQDDDGHVQSPAPATKTATHLVKTSQKYYTCHTKNDFRHVTKHVWMSRSATPATRIEATRRLKPPKMPPTAELTIGTAIRGSCERLRTVGQRRANTPSTPRPPEWNGNPCYAFEKKGDSMGFDA